VSQITSTSATCGQFSGGTAQTLAAATYTARNGRIKSVNPSGFDYWVRVTASAGANTFVVPQSITTGNFTTLFGLGSGSGVFGSGCAGVAGATFTASANDDTFTIRWNASSAGTNYVSVHLATSGVRNKPAPSPPVVHYAFSTNGVTGSTSGIDLSP
jgi:hypothetical protein